MKIALTNYNDFMALFVRRKWWSIVTFTVLAGAATVVAYCLPSVYVSEAVVLVQPRGVSEDYVNDLATGTVEQRLTTLQETVLSRTNLDSVATEFENRFPEFLTMNADQRVNRLRNDIDIQFHTEIDAAGRATPVSSISIAYQHQEPDLAQAMASRVTELFLEYDESVRRGLIGGTTEFLQSRLADVAADLEASEREVEALRSGNQRALPEQFEANLATLSRLSQDRQTNADAIRRNATTRRNLERELLDTPQTLAPNAVREEPLVAELRAAMLELEQVAARYTPDHPDYGAAETRVQFLRSQLPPGFELTEVDQTGNLPNPLYQQLTSQLADTETEAEILEGQREQILSEINYYNNLVSSTPALEQRMGDALRRNAALRDEHDRLNNQLGEARLAERLELEERASQFAILDPANFPFNPSKPNKKLVLAGALVMSFIFSLALAVAVDVFQQQVWSQTEIENFWGAHVLVDIPEIVTQSDLAEIQKRKVTLAASVVGAAGIYTVCLYLMYLQHEFVIGRLSPILNRLVY